MAWGVSGKIRRPLRLGKRPSWREPGMWSKLPFSGSSTRWFVGPDVFRNSLKGGLSLEQECLRDQIFAAPKRLGNIPIREPFLHGRDTKIEGLSPEFCLHCPSFHPFIYCREFDSGMYNVRQKDNIYVTSCQGQSNNSAPFVKWTKGPK